MKIIYIVFAPIPIHYAKFLNIQNFQNEGFDIHICDVSSFFYSKDETQAYFNSTVSFYKPKLNNVTMIKNFDELKNFFYNFNISNTLIYYTGRSFYKRYSENKIFDFIISLKFKIILSEFVTEFYPVSLKDKFKFQLFIIRNKFNFRNYNNLNFIGAGKNIENISKKIFNKTLNYYSIPHPNYIWTESESDNNFTVYVEESLNGAPDNNVRKAVGGKFKGQILGKTDFLNDSEKNAKIFYEKLNNFFEKFETKFKQKIIIAASGKYFYNENPFGGRIIKYGDTINLINNSKYILGHSSMALWQSIISKKKLILLTNEQLSLYKRLEIEYFSKKIKSKIFNLSNQNLIEDIFSNDFKNNYQKQINFFLNSSNYKKNFKEVMIQVINLIMRGN